MNTYIGVITKIIDPDLYTVEVDIPGENEQLKAFPIRGEIDEPRVGDSVLLREIDPIYHSYYIYEKLKENSFIGIRSRGKVLRMSAEEVSIGIFDPEDTEWADKNDGEDPTPKPTTWIKVDSEGNIDINAEGNETVKIAGNATIEVTGDVSLKATNINVESSENTTLKAVDVTVEASGDVKVTADGDASLKASNVTVEASGNADIKSSSSTIDSSTVKITGGTCEIGGTVAPTGTGAFCGVPNCIFSGAPHVGKLSSGT